MSEINRPWKANLWYIQTALRPERQNYEYLGYTQFDIQWRFIILKHYKR